MVATLVRSGALLASALVLAGCGLVSADMVFGEDNDSGSATWSGEPFDRVVVAGSDNIEFTTADSHSVTPTGDPAVLEKLRFSVKDGTLTVSRRRSSFSFGDSGSALVKVAAPSLRGLTVAGSGDATADRLAGDAKLSIAGSGSIAVAALASDRLDANIAGSGTMRLAGVAKEADISIAGSGDIKGEALRVDKADISIAGSGDVALASDGEVEAKLMGSGDVTIKGKAKCTAKSMGSGALRCG